MGPAVIQTPAEYTNDLSNRENMRSILDLLDTTKYNYLVEFRNQSWFDENGLLESSQELLSDYNVGCIISDEFSLPMDCKGDNIYIRLRGKGRSEYPGDNSYQYTDAELAWFKGLLDDAGKTCRQIRVYFENSAAARSVYDAMRLMDIMQIPHRIKDMRDAEAPRIIAK